MDLVTGIRSQWDRLLAVAALLAGVIVLIVGWFGVSGTPYPAAQLPYVISAGLGGLFLLGVSAVLWLSADLHDEWRKLDRIEQALREAESTHAPLGAEHVAEHEPRPEEAAHGTRPPSGDGESERTRRLPRVAAEGVT